MMVTQEEKLSHYCGLASTSSPDALADVIERATSDPMLHIFGELLDMGPVQALMGTEREDAVKILGLMARGTYRDCVTLQGRVELNSIQITKLRQLTLVTLAGRRNVLPYATLMEELGIESIRELEDLIIGTIYAGLIRGKMDQMKSRLVVTAATGRDVVEGSQMESMKESVVRWQQCTAEVLAELENRIVSASESWAEATRKKTALVTEREHKLAEQRQRLGFGTYTGDRARV